MAVWRTVRHAGWVGASAAVLAGCRTPEPCLPAGAIPAGNGAADVQAACALASAPVPMRPTSPTPSAPGQPPKRAPFELPPQLPGADLPPVIPPRFTPETPAAERDERIRKTYPELTPVAASLPAARAALTLADLQQLALANSPVLRRARADAEASYGAVVQAGLHPNPTVGWEADQWQPGRGPTHNNGQEGAFLNQLIKYPGKLSLAQAVAGFDYLNGLVAARRAEVDVTTAVRTAYFAAVVARKGVEVNTALVEMADEVYRIQLKQLAAGESAGYEPLQLFAQAAQARNALAQSQATERAAWRQLAAAVGRPDLPPAPLAGVADLPVPPFDFAAAQAFLLERHTDLATAQNSLAQAQVNLRLQRLMPYPDLVTNTVVQHDNGTGNPQFNLQLGVQLPIFDRNQGNVRQAQATIARATENVAAARNDLLGRLAEAYGRYEANRAIAERFRADVLPNLGRAYRALVRRYQGEPAAVGFNDIVTAQLNYAQALQGYLTALDAQWRAVVDVANLAQLDDLYPPSCPPAAPAK